MLHLPLPSNLSITQTPSVGLFFPECDSDQCLLPHRSLHRASHEDALYEARTRLFHRSCHWHAVLHCHPAAPARGLPSIHPSFYLINTLTDHKHFFFCFALLENLVHLWPSAPLSVPWSYLCPLCPAFALSGRFSRALISTVEGFLVLFCPYCITDQLGGGGYICVPCMLCLHLPLH